MQGARDFGEVFDETPIEITETDKLTYHFDVPWRLPLTDGVDLHALHFKPIGGQLNTKEVDLFLVEFAFLGIEGDLGVAAPLEEVAVGLDVSIEIEVVRVRVIEVPD